MAFVHYSYQSLVEGCWYWGERVHSPILLVCHIILLERWVLEPRKDLRHPKTYRWAIMVRHRDMGGVSSSGVPWINLLTLRIYI